MTIWLIEGEPKKAREKMEAEVAALHARVTELEIQLMCVTEQRDALRAVAESIEDEDPTRALAIIKHALAKESGK